MPPVFIEVVVFAFIVVVAVTQVLLPAIANTTMFPSFRFKRRHRKLSEARADIEDARLEAEAAAEREIADRIRQETRSHTKEAEQSCETSTHSAPVTPAAASPVSSVSDSPSSSS